MLTHFLSFKLRSGSEGLFVISLKQKRMLEIITFTHSFQVCARLSFVDTGLCGWNLDSFIPFTDLYAASEVCFLFVYYMCVCGRLR